VSDDEPREIDSEHVSEHDAEDASDLDKRKRFYKNKEVKKMIKELKKNKKVSRRMRRI
jgi:hypothetical protein